MISRRDFLASTACAGAAALAPLPVRAQAYPNNIVRIIVPFPPGGATDVLGRVVAHHLQGLWGQTVVTEYKPGASGLLGARQVITSPADGYTLMLASTGAILSVAASQGTEPANYEVTKELSPISLVAAPSYILVVNPSVPVKSAAEHHRLCQGQSRQADLRLVGRRHRVASLRRAVRPDGRASTCCTCRIAAPVRR